MIKNSILNKAVILLSVMVTMGLAGVVAAKTMPITTNESEGNKSELTYPTPTVDSKRSPETSAPSLTPTLDRRCIVTLFGQKYDVTYLRNTHSGGDVFKCGTDMTEIYKDKHGTNLDRMQNYLLGSNGAAPNPQATGRQRQEREDDD